MNDPKYKDLRKKEYVDGKRTWDVGLTSGDYSRFIKEYVIPLRQLNGQGIFGSFEEIKYAVSGDEVQTTEIVVS